MKITNDNGRYVIEGALVTISSKLGGTEVCVMDGDTCVFYLFTPWADHVAVVSGLYERAERGEGQE